jgi:hypothetical protein
MRRDGSVFSVVYILYIDKFHQCTDDLLNFRSNKTFLFPIERHLQATNWGHLLKEGLYSKHTERCIKEIRRF